MNVLVNDAGQGEWGRFAETNLERELDIVQLNVASLISLTKYFLKDMVARNEGKILQVASVLGKIPSPLMAVYSGTKAFVLAFSEALIDELKATNVTVTVLLPGASDTDFFHKANAEDTVVYRETDLSDPDEVAKDGYEALKKGESKIVSGLKNKLQVTMSNILPDSITTATVRKQMEESDKDVDEGREHSDHHASQEERQIINKETGDNSGDYGTNEGKNQENFPEESRH